MAGSKKTKKSGQVHIGINVSSSKRPGKDLMERSDTAWGRGPSAVAARDLERAYWVLDWLQRQLPFAEEELELLLKAYDPAAMGRRGYNPGLFALDLAGRVESQSNVDRSKATELARRLRALSPPESWALLDRLERMRVNTRAD